MEQISHHMQSQFNIQEPSSTHGSIQKFGVALEAFEFSKTISQLSSEHEIQANLIRTWKRQLLEDGPSVKRSAWLGPRSSTPPRAHSSQPMPSPPACSLPLIIARMANRFGGTDYQAVMAGSVLVSIPPLIVFLIFQKNFVRGIALTGLKG